MRYCTDYIYHSYVYNKYQNLNAGIQYIFETRDLQRAFPNYSADTVMYLVRGTSIVAYNDDYNGLASLIAYQPTVTGSYRLIIRGYSKYSRGTCDVYKSSGGGAPSRIENNVAFGGYPISAHWKNDERLETTSSTGDTYLYLIHGNTMLLNDDGGEGLQSKITPGYSGYGKVIVGSWRSHTQGRTKLCNFYQSYLDNPGSEYEEVDDPKFVVSETMYKYQQELMKYKASLRKLAPEELSKASLEEQEQKIQDLQKKFLSEEELKLFESPEPPVNKKYQLASEQYNKLLQGAEKRLETLSQEEKSKEMAKFEFEKEKLFKDIIP